MGTQNYTPIEKHCKHFFEKFFNFFQKARFHRIYFCKNFIKNIYIRAHTYTNIKKIPVLPRIIFFLVQPCLFLFGWLERDEGGYDNEHTEHDHQDTDDDPERGLELWDAKIKGGE